MPPKPFQIFLSGGAAVGKSFLIKAVTEYLKRVLRYPNLDQPSVLVTACTGKAAINGINGITLYSAFHLPVKSGLKSSEYKKPSDETLHMSRNKYQYLNVLIVDEISMIGRETFGDLDLALKAIMQNSSPFGGVSLLVVGDILQPPPVNKKSMFMKPTKGSLGHSVDGCGKNSNCMSWLRLSGRAVIQTLLNYLIGFEKVSKQIMMYLIDKFAIIHRG